MRYSVCKAPVLALTSNHVDRDVIFFKLYHATNNLHGFVMKSFAMTKIHKL